jgi:hypothetical protein
MESAVIASAGTIGLARVDWPAAPLAGALGVPHQRLSLSGPMT